MFKKSLKKFLIKINSKIERYKEEGIIGLCKGNTKFSEGTAFFKTSMIYNFQKNRNKIVIGTNSQVHGELLIFKYGGEIIIGNNCYIGENTKIRSGEKIIIGNDVLISHNVHIIDNTAHEINYIERAEGFKKIINTNSLPEEKGNIKTNLITIEDNVWINFNAIILKGVTIGKGSIIAAGSVVTKTIPPFSLVAGNPAKVIKTVS
jgi:acetyltransferase-like isoleucine patch superfamily enzyme